MKILNYTPHSLNFFNLAQVAYVQDMRKYVAMAVEQPIESIPSSGMLSANIKTVPSHTLNGIQVFMKEIESIDPLPQGDCIVVSQLYASGAKLMGVDTSSLYTVADPVYSTDGRTILGCLGICPVF